MAKKSETGFDLLQRDINETSESDSQELDFTNYDLDTTDLPSYEEETDGELEELKPSGIEISSLDEVEEKEEEAQLEEDSPKDINSMFEIATSGVQEAKNIFAKNVEMKEQLDAKFKELEEAKKEYAKIKQADIEKINSYKEAVTSKLRQKKEELDEQVEKLKEARSKYEQEKTRFETYKKEEFERVKQMKKEQRQEMEERQKELDALTESLKKQREEIEEEKRQLEIDRIKYDADKNELANNLLKFNELVSDFTVNIDKFNN